MRILTRTYPWRLDASCGGMREKRGRAFETRIGFQCGGENASGFFSSRACGSTVGRLIGRIMTTADTIFADHACL